MQVELSFPFTATGTAAQDANLLLDVLEYVLVNREQMVKKKKGMLEPLTTERVAMAVRFIGEVITACLDEAERVKTDNT